MKKTMTVRAAAVVATGVLGVAMASCSSNDEGRDAGQPMDSMAQETTTMPGGSGSTDATTSSGNSEATAAPGSGEAPKVTFDGRDVAAEFQPATCEWGTDEGHPQLEYDAGSESTGGDLEVEIVMSDPPKLDDFALETNDADWKAHSDQRAQAQITVDVDTYHVTSQVSEDDGTRTGELDVTFTCAGR